MYTYFIINRFLFYFLENLILLLSYVLGENCKKTYAVNVISLDNLSYFQIAMNRTQMF